MCIRDRLWGADFETALRTGEGFFARVHPEDRDAVRRVLYASVDSGAPYSMEYRIDHPERGVRWICLLYTSRCV